MKRELVERARAGDHEAFSELARASIGRLYALANLVLHDVDRAQDAVQDALVSAWKDLRALRDPDAWDAWLHRLTLRACYKVAQKERRHDHVELRVVPDPDRARPFDLAVSVVERDRMEQELGRLPLDQRAVMVLHFYLDLPLSEAAVILDIPIGTAKSRLSRGLDALRESMRDEPDFAARLARERTA